MTDMRERRPIRLWFDTPFQWERINATRWIFEDGWGTFTLTRYRKSRADERRDTGWYLTTPDDEWGEYMGATITAAASNELTLAAIMDRMGTHKK